MREAAVFDELGKLRGEFAEEGVGSGASVCEFGGSFEELLVAVEFFG